MNGVGDDLVAKSGRDGLAVPMPILEGEPVPDASLAVREALMNAAARHAHGIPVVRMPQEVQAKLVVVLIDVDEDARSTFIVYWQSS